MRKKAAAKTCPSQYLGHMKNAEFNIRRVKWTVGQVVKSIKGDDVRGAQLDAALAVRLLGRALDSLVWAMEWKPKR